MDSIDAHTAIALSEQKNALRSAMRRQLRDLDPAQRSACSQKIVRQIVASTAWQRASRVLLFAPLPAEPDVDLLWRDGALAGKQCAYPLVEGGTMQSYYVSSLDELRPTRWGLREPLPKAGREAALDGIGLVLVPGLAFDATGGRLGRGGGYYDRLLANRDPAKTRLVGIGFSFQRIEGTLPLAAHDVKMDEICVA